MIPQTTLRRALADPNLLASVLTGDSWKAWRILLIAAMGEELTDDERVIFKQLTGRDREPNAMVEELVGVIGRRGGKSRAISVVATYVAGLCKHPALVRGERGILLVIAPDQRQADIVLDFTTANFEDSPILSQLIEQRVARSLRLNNNITIEVRAADFRNLRGPTYVCGIADESAFWLTENSVNPDSEILNAVRPGLATTNGPLFLISSPYARRGELWRDFDRHYGAAGDPLILVAQGASRTFNPTLSQSVVDRAMERDPASASAEFLAQFRTDIESYISVEAVRACVSAGIYERAPVSGTHYVGFVDPSGGSADSFALGIGHVEYARQTVVIDCVRETKPPFSPEIVVEDYSKVLKDYNIGTITGDRYAGVWPVEQFAKSNITYVQSAAPKSDLYRDTLPLINSARVELLDNAKLVAQLCALERRTARGGKDSINHPPGGHDDLINVVAGVCATNNKYGSYNLNYSEWVTGVDADDPDGSRAWRAARLAAYLYSGGLIR
jgi:hypothetical protein